MKLHRLSPGRYYGADGRVEIKAIGTDPKHPKAWKLEIDGLDWGQHETREKAVSLAKKCLAVEFFFEGPHE